MDAVMEGQTTIGKINCSVASAQDAGMCDQCISTHTALVQTTRHAFLQVTYWWMAAMHAVSANWLFRMWVSIHICGACS